MKMDHIVSDGIVAH